MRRARKWYIVIGGHQIIGFRPTVKSAHRYALQQSKISGKEVWYHTDRAWHKAHRTGRNLKGYVVKWEEE